MDYCSAWLLTPNSSFYVISIDRSEEMWLVPDYGKVKNIDYRQLFYDTENEEFHFRKVYILYSLISNY